MSLDTSRVTRRTTLKLAGAGLLAAGLGSGVAAGHTGRARGETGDLYGQSIHSYVERDGGRLSAVGVHFGGALLDAVDGQASDHVHLGLPNGDTGRFEFAGVDWNEHGHEPPGLYDDPHFDFHFYMMAEADVEAIPFVLDAPYTIPDALRPANTFRTTELGAAPVNTVVPAMGEHLVSIPSSMPTGPDWSVWIWGAYDPDGDGVGQLTFAEPMITLAYLQGFRGDCSRTEAADVPMPERFVTGGWYPTSYVVRYDADADAFTVSLEDFAQFSGYGRR